MDLNAFTQTGDTVALAATDASGSVSFGTRNLKNEHVLITNLGPNTAYVVFGVSPTATTAGVPVQAGDRFLTSVGAAVTHAAAICATGETAALRFTLGRGS